MLRARVFPDKESKGRKSKYLKQARMSEKAKNMALVDGRNADLVEPEKIVRYRFDQELVRRLVLRQPIDQIVAAMGGKDKRAEIVERLGQADFREKLNEYTLGGVKRLEAEVQDSLKELQMILRLSADEMMQVVLSIARRTTAKDADRITAAKEIMDRAQALLPVRVNSPAQGGNTYLFGNDVVKEALAAHLEMSGAQDRLMPAERTVGSMSVEERDELRQLAVDENG